MKGISIKIKGCFKGVYSGFRDYLKEVQREISKMFQGSLKDVPRKFIVLQGSFKGVSSKFQECFNGVLSGFQGCCKAVQRVFEGSFKCVLRMF